MVAMENAFPWIASGPSTAAGGALTIPRTSPLHPARHPVILRPKAKNPSPTTPLKDEKGRGGGKFFRL